MEEIWKTIPGYPDYEVSNMGRIKSFKRKTPRILKGSTSPFGYPQVYFGQIYRFVMLAFVGPCPEGMEICHNDGNPANSKLDNLRYDTHRANVDDALRSGTMFRKITADQAVEIRGLRKDGLSLQKIAEKYNVHPQTISNICTGKTHRHVPGEIDPFPKNYELSRQRASRIRNAYATGHYTMTELAKVYGLSSSAVSLIIRGKCCTQPATETNPE